CAGSTGNVYTTEPGMTNYIWAVSAGGAITAGGSGYNTVTVKWNTAGPQTVSASYMDGNGCYAAASTVKDVTVNASPVPTIDGPATACTGSAGNVYITEPGMSNYSWTISAGGTITSGGTGTDNTVTVTWTGAGSRSVSVNYKNGSGCLAASATVKNVTVSLTPTPTMTGGPASVCAGASGNVYTTQPGMTNYIWTVSAGGTITGGGTSSDNSVTVTWNTAGTESVTVTYTGAGGCTPAPGAIGTTTVTVNPIPGITISGDNSVCQGTIVTYTAVVTNGGVTPGYHWFINGLSAPASVCSGATYCYAPANGDKVTCKVTTLAGCFETSNEIDMTVAPAPSPALTGPASVCVNSTGNVYSTDPGKSNYQWNVSSGGAVTAGGTAADASVTITWTSAGAKTVTVNYEDGGCSAASPTVKNVTVHALPVPVIAGGSTACGIPSSGNIYSTTAGMTGYTWTVSSGGTIDSGDGTESISVTWATTGTKTVTVTYVDANGCSPATPSGKTVNVYALPVPSLAGPALICGIPSSGNTYTTEPGKSNYSWSVSAGGTINSG
ncbi:MAG: hypothetical protein WCK34_19355, partial [Bacteroidota bacterium]